MHYVVAFQGQWKQKNLIFILLGLHFKQSQYSLSLFIYSFGPQNYDLFYSNSSWKILVIIVSFIG